MPKLEEKFREQTGAFHYLQAGDTAAVYSLLVEHNHVAFDEKVLSAYSAGDGNMNVTLRVITETDRFILKQSRPWVAKYPDIPAPVERIDVEGKYITTVRKDRILKPFTPAPRDYYARDYVLLMEDITDAEDLSYCYAADRQIPNAVVRDMLTYLSALHRLPGRDFPENMALRQLNHAHIFDLPFRPDNGFPLDDLFPGLAEIAQPLQHDKKLRAAAKALGETYLGTRGRALIHGDFYPGSMLSKNGRLYVIDGEFAFRGFPEFDLGVLLAHLMLARAPTEQLKMLDNYEKGPGFDAGLVRRFAYVEIIRRLIGIAQLPLALTLEERRDLLEQARIGLT